MITSEHCRRESRTSVASLLRFCCPGVSAAASGSLLRGCEPRCEFRCDDSRNPPLASSAAAAEALSPPPRERLAGTSFPFFASSSLRTTARVRTASRRDMFRRSLMKGSESLDASLGGFGRFLPPRPWAAAAAWWACGRAGISASIALR